MNRKDFLRVLVAGCVGKFSAKLVNYSEMYKYNMFRKPDPSRIIRMRPMSEIDRILEFAKKT